MGPVGMPGANLSRASNYNSRLVLDRIRLSRDGISRVEIAENTSLSLQTVSNQVSRLMAQGLIAEGKPRKQPMGKPRTPLLINADAGYAIGMHVDPARVSFVVVDLRVTLAHRTSFPMPDSIDGLISLTKDYVEAATSELTAGRVLGIGIGTPGPVDMDTGEVVAPPNLPGWERVPLRRLVAEETGLNTFMQKDSIAALTGELWLSGKSRQGGTLFAYMGYGVGFATANHGIINLGHSGNAGELGHMHTGSVGPSCRCGRYGCLGMHTSPAYLVESAVKRGVLVGPAPVTPPEISVALSELLVLASRGDIGAVEIIGGAGEELARGLVNLVDFSDASLVIGGGPNAAGFWPFIEPAFVRHYAEFGASRGVHDVEIMTSGFKEWVVAAGAATIVLDNAFSPRADQVFSPGTSSRQLSSSTSSFIV